MAKIEILAIPSDAPGGLAAALAARPHACHALTLVTLVDGEVVASRLIEPIAQPDGAETEARRLAAAGVTAVAAAGIGRTLLPHLTEVGIRPHLACGLPNVGAVVDAYLNGALPLYPAAYARIGARVDTDSRAGTEALA
jgi:predicted Fe-Mo cluster-binding NifX family protein